MTIDILEYQYYIKIFGFSTNSYKTRLHHFLAWKNEMWHVKISTTKKILTHLFELYNLVLEVDE